MRVVLDTNVLVSALLRTDGNPASILNLAFGGKLMLCIDSRILLEYEDVLSRPKFAINAERREAVLNYIKGNSITVAPEPFFIPFVDKDDRRFYEVAASAKAWLVTGNMRHYPAEPFVVTPADFLSKFTVSGQTSG